MRLPRWTVEIVVLLAVAGITFGATRFVDSTRFEQRMEDRMTASEHDRQEIRKELERIKDEQQKGAEFDSATRVRFDSMDKNISDITIMMREHMNQESQNWRRKAQQQ